MRVFWGLFDCHRSDLWQSNYRVKKTLNCRFWKNCVALKNHLMNFMSFCVALKNHLMNFMSYMSSKNHVLIKIAHIFHHMSIAHILLCDIWYNNEGVFWSSKSLTELIVTFFYDTPFSKECYLIISYLSKLQKCKTAFVVNSTSVGIRISPFSIRYNEFTKKWNGSLSFHLILSCIFMDWG